MESKVSQIMFKHALVAASTYIQRTFIMAVDVAQLVELLLPIPEVRGLNPVIGKIY